MQAAEATSADDGDDDDVFTEPRSPAQRLIAMEKAKFHRMTSRKTLKRSRTRTTRKTRYGQVGATAKKKKKKKKFSLFYHCQPEHCNLLNESETFV